MGWQRFSSLCRKLTVLDSVVIVTWWWMWVKKKILTFPPPPSLVPDSPVSSFLSTTPLHVFLWKAVSFSLPLLSKTYFSFFEQFWLGGSEEKGKREYFFFLPPSLSPVFQFLSSFLLLLFLRHPPPLPPLPPSLFFLLPRPFGQIKSISFSFCGGKNWSQRESLRGEAGGEERGKSDEKRTLRKTTLVL